MRKSRFVTQGLSMIMAAALMLSACGANTNTEVSPTGTSASVISTENNGTENGGAAETVGADAADQATEKPEEEAVKTWDGVIQFLPDEDYQPNIIDDNYRNYYEIFVMSYCDSDGDGVGDLNGVTSKLDYIQDMGFNGIWFMPIMPSPSYHKYDVLDYYAIDEEYGTIEDFQNLLTEAHSRGINVIIDLVLNHSSSGHPWFLEAAQYLMKLPADQEPDLNECPYVDYYHFARGSKPNNDYHQLGGSDWWYESGFSTGMPDLNLQNEAVRAEIENIAKYWLDMGVDGFRLDAVKHFVSNKTSDNVEILGWLYDYCSSIKPDVYMVGECWVQVTAAAPYYASGVNSFFNFSMGDTDGNLVKTVRGTLTATQFVKAMAKYEETFAEYNENAIDAPFLTNHDMTRIANPLGSDIDQMKMAAALLMSMNGSPFVYYGEEIGMKSKGSSDPNKRIPFVWTKGEYEGITDLPDGAEEGIESNFPGLDEQLQDPDSLLYFYRDALHLRNENPEIARGSIMVLEELCDGKTAAITKTYNDSTIGMVYNTAETEITVNLAGSELSGMAVKGFMSVSGVEPSVSGDVLTVPGRCIVILK